MVKAQKKISSNSQGNIVNDIIFRELIKRGYSFEGNNKVWNIADSKLWYSTPEQSKAFLDLEKKDMKQKMFASKEIALINEKFGEISGGITGKKVNIVDLGCGNGEKAMVFLKHAQKKSCVRYYPIDASEFMIEKALENVSKTKKIHIIKSKNNVFDFFDFGDIANSIREKDFRTNYLLLLGGNLENSDVHELLHEIRTGMKDGDYLLIGNKLSHPNVTKMIQYYNRSKPIDELLFKTLEQLGFKREELDYGARFRGNRIEMLYTIKNDKTISSKGKTIDFNAGDKIIVTFSYKYTDDSLKEVLMMYFDDVELHTSKDGIFALALCKK